MSKQKSLIVKMLDGISSSMPSPDDDLMIKGDDMYWYPSYTKEKISKIKHNKDNLETSTQDIIESII